MRRTNRLIHALVCLVLIWQGAAGALAAGRMAGLDPALARVLCRAGAQETQSGDPISVADHAFCGLHCGAIAIARPPGPARISAPLAFAPARYEASRLADILLSRADLRPPPRGPPLRS